MTFEKDRTLFFSFLGDSSPKTLSYGNGNDDGRSRGEWRREWRLSQLKPPGTANRIPFSIRRHSICAFFPINCCYVGVRLANVNKSRGLVPHHPKNSPTSHRRFHWGKLRNHPLAVLTQTYVKQKNRKRQELHRRYGLINGFQLKIFARHGLSSCLSFVWKWELEMRVQQTISSYIRFEFVYVVRHRPSWSFGFWEQMFAAQFAQLPAKYLCKIKPISPELG